MSGDAFGRLSPALAHQIVHQLGFTGLRPVQEQATTAVLDDVNCVVLAPTAGGKTEAAFFPLLSRMDTEDWRPVSVIYLSPIRALLNNQEERVQRLAGLIGRRAMKWHGDVDAGPRARFLREPADILLTTPESLEAMLMSPRVPARELFRGLRTVIVDEVHAFAADDRGAHLSSVLERTAHLAERDIQRIGLSATVGNPDAILSWLRGSSRRAGRVVDPGGAKKRPSIQLDYVGSLDNAALAIEKLHPGKKRLVFVDSRGKAEDLGKHLNGRDVTAFVAHGSLSAPERRDAEHAFAEGEDCVIVATSAMELGIDVGDLDQVLQIDAPSTVASFLQRMGRTGRREGAVPNCTFLATKEDAILQAAALLTLNDRGWVESVRPPLGAAHIWAHQVMALGIQTGGLVRGDLEAWIGGAAAFRELTAETRALIVDTMIEREVLADHDGRLWLGPVGEKKYGRANFRELYAVFSAPRLITVEWGGHEVGSVDATFLMAISEDAKGPATFILGGKSWELTFVDWKRGKASVSPAPEGRAPRWGGGPRFLSYDMCQAMRRVLVGDDLDPRLTRRAATIIESLRGEHAFLKDGDESPIIEAAGETLWWNFAGGAANVLLARMLEHELGEKVVARDMRLKLTGDAAKSGSRLRQVLRTWAGEGRPTDDEVVRWTAAAEAKRLSKFEPCLPDAEVARLHASRTLDARGAQAALAIRQNRT